MTFTSSSSRPVSLVKRSDRNTGTKGPLAAKLGTAYQQDTAGLARLLTWLQYVILAGFIVLIVLLANFSSATYRLFATTSEGKLNIPPPIDQEIGDNVVSLWVVDAMTRALTMGFHDYQLRLLEIRPFFNDRGWESFTRFQRAPYGPHISIRAALENEYMLMKARPRSTPQILEKSLVQGVFTYRVQINMAINRYQETVNDNSFNETYELLIERVRPEVNPSGIAIAQWRFLSSQ